MSRLVSAALFLALGGFTASAGPAAAAAPQPLTIDLRTDQPHIERLERYTSSDPIAVRVTAQPAQGVALMGLAPDGASLHEPLVRAADGVFTGSITLAVPGMWKLAVATTVNGAETASETFSVAVAERASPVSVAAMIALAALSIGGGVGLIAIGRRTSAPPVAGA